MIMPNSVQQTYRRNIRNYSLILLAAGLFLPMFNIGVLSFCLCEKLLLIPCPFCGVRSSVYALFTGHWQQAIVFNMAGPFVLFALVLYALYFAVAYRHNLPLDLKTEVKARELIDGAVFGLLGIQWILKLFTGGL